ncbi:AAA family ATPase [Halococcus hamelinensis]|uniref:Methanol dehydrogenase regulatory protein n=1 Tax=Halococcus hamelinensis 100A6 TaxID=1132509 RepID=M0M3B8_9EURY|nr:MoxR family ATPase [Halococcus hamelinensis]EMA39903.1 methanol dehydrogenase regulatory protein [Halococcus hamelinensis 100A6]
MDVTAANEETDAVLDALGATVIAERSLLETVLLGVLARGHVLFEDVPGTGKTLIARSTARALGLSFSRVQFTPDLLPADVTGTHIYNEGTSEFEFSPGPVFANVVLADEINRAPPKTQAALLEAMEEGQVTVDGETHDLPEPFFVLATQNPVEMAGTFELPEAQVDRFLVKTGVGYPDEAGEIELLRRRAAREERSPAVEEVLSAERVRALQTVPETVRVDEDLLAYLVAIARATRQRSTCSVGVSPRGTQRLFEAVRARAVLSGRDFVTPDDVKAIVPAVCAHRLVLTPDAAVENVEKRSVVADVLDSVPVPTV